MSDDNDPVARAIANARTVTDDAPPVREDLDRDSDYDGERDYAGEAPSDSGALTDETMAIVQQCAALDPSDTDNARRLIAHRGQDLAVLMEIGGKLTDATWFTWTGKHWDGRDPKRAVAIAQTIGGLIAQEAEFLPLDPEFRNYIVYQLPFLNDEADSVLQLIRELEREKAELTAPQPRIDPIAAASASNVVPLPVKRSTTDIKLEKIAIDEQQAELKDRLKMIQRANAEALAHLDALEKKKARRRAFGVTTKNAGRINAMLQMAAPHLVVEPKAWDAQQRITYVNNGVLIFEKIDDPEPCSDEPRKIGRVRFVENGWRREDRVTMTVPFDYVPDAKAPKFRAFLHRFLPDAQVRAALQVFCGLGLTGIPIQMLFFHYGLGANGKSVFMEVISRVCGALAQSLPPSSIVGSDSGNAGGASPDIAMLFGKRMVRVSELPAGEEMREALVKALTGGEDLIARHLHKGYFTFQPQFKAHMSGNAYPRVKGSDTGIWRRLMVVPWTVTIPEAERRDFEAVVSELMEEAEGILAWMVRGVVKFDTYGLIIPRAMREAADAFRSEMDTFTPFAEQCIIADPASAGVRAAYLYECYERWSKANGREPMHKNMFGRIAGQHYSKKRDESGALYAAIRLHNVPSADETRNPDE